jgi:hypothetical protein
MTELRGSTLVFLCLDNFVDDLVFFRSHVFMDGLTFLWHPLFVFYCLYSYRPTCVRNLFLKEELPVSVATVGN